MQASPTVLRRYNLRRTNKSQGSRGCAGHCPWVRFTLIELLVVMPSSRSNCTAHTRRSESFRDAAPSVRFTLVELLVVIATITILIALLIPAGVQRVSGGRAANADAESATTPAMALSAASGI